MGCCCSCWSWPISQFDTSIGHVCAGIEEYFDNIQIIPYTQKDTTHFPKIRKALDIPYNQMLFFDDENGNIARVRAPLSSCHKIMM